MKPEEYLQQFKDLGEKKLKVTKAKNADYSGKVDAFANFRIIEELTQGRVSVEDGLLVRMTDKMARIANLLKAEGQVNEAITDTLEDLSVYADILNIYISNKDK